MKQLSGLYSYLMDGFKLILDIYTMFTVIGVKFQAFRHRSAWHFMSAASFIGLTSRTIRSLFTTEIAPAVALLDCDASSIIGDISVALPRERRRNVAISATCAAHLLPADTYNLI